MLRKNFGSAAVDASDEPQQASRNRAMVHHCQLIHCQPDVCYRDLCSMYTGLATVGRGAPTKPPLLGPKNTAKLWVRSSWYVIRSSPRFLVAVANGPEAYSSFTDLVLALFPILIIWKLKMETRIKLGLIGVMSLGVLYVQHFKLHHRS